MPVRMFPYWTDPDYGFRQPFCLQKDNGNFEKPQKFNEFSKLSTKSCMNWTMRNNVKESFKYHESNNNKKNNIENDDFMSRYIYVCKVRC